MYSLNESQIRLIRQEVSRQEVSLGHLADDLIDHICCEIEYRMANPRDFDLVYRDILSEIGHTGLQKIQFDTLYLIDKNYRLMKNTMKIAGVVSMAFIAFGSLFKIMHYPGANILFIAGFSVLGLAFFPSALLIMKKESNHQSHTMMYGAALLGGIALMAGILFRVMHWPESTTIMTAGYIMLTVVFLPLLLVNLFHETEDSNLRYAYAFGAGSLFISTIGFILKLNHMPGAAVLLLLGSVGLTTVFLPWYSHLMYLKKGRFENSFLFLCTGVMYFILFNLLLSVS